MRAYPLKKCKNVRCVCVRVLCVRNYYFFDLLREERLPRVYSVVKSIFVVIGYVG
jgi:hypothetical protein